MSGTLKFIILLLIVTGPIASVEASWGSVFFHGMKVVTAKTGQLFGKGSRTAGHTAGTATRKTSAKVASGVTAGLSSKAGGAAAKVAAPASQVVLERLGVQGMTALAKLPASQAKRLADLSGALAKSPHKAAWLSTIATHGGRAIDFLWQHKAGLAAGTVLSVALLKPEDFLATLGEVTTTTIEATGEYIVEPVVTGTAKHIVAPAVQTAVVQWWLYPLLTSMSIAGWLLWKLRRKPR